SQTSSANRCAVTSALHRMIQECVLISPSCSSVLVLPIATRSAAAPIELSKPPCYIILRLSFLWICKNARRCAKLDQPADVKESWVIGYTAGLLHIMRDRYDRVFRLQLGDQLLDLCRRDWIERRTRFIHQDHVGFHSKRAGNAKPLLLATR